MNEREFALATITLRSLVAQKRWCQAEKFLGSLPDEWIAALPLWLVRHVRASAAGEHEYIERHASLDALANRGTRVLKNFKWVGATPLASGMMNFALYVHHFEDGNRKKKIVEKVYLNSRTPRLEKNFLESASSRIFKSPKYFGSLKFGPFLSLFIEHVSGANPDRASFESTWYPRAIATLWKASPQGVSETGPKNFLEKAQVLELLGNMISFNPGISRKHLNPIIENLDEIICSHKQSPACIMHGDLHRFNIIARGDDFRIIDWDKWSIIKVGMGFQLENAGFAGSPRSSQEWTSLIDRLYATTQPESQITRKQFWTNFVLYTLKELSSRDPDATFRLAESYVRAFVRRPKRRLYDLYSYLAR